MHARWIIAALLFLSSVLNYIDRQVLSVLAPLLTKEFSLTPQEYSYIGMAFTIPYTLMYVGSGALVDRWGTKKALAIFMAWWSLAGMLHAGARSAVSLGVCRFLLGIGEPGNFMAGFRAISEWYEPKHKAFVNGLLNGGAAVGAIIAPPAVGWLTLHYGWRFTFLLTGGLGFVWLAAWLYFYGTPPFAASGSAPRTPWRVLLTRVETWALLLPRFISDPVWWFYLIWLPKYLGEQRGFTLADIAKLAWMPYLAADAGAIAAGLFTGWLVKRGMAPVRARRHGMWPFALLMPLSLLIPGVSSNQALGIICVIAFAHMAWKTNLQTVTNDVFPLAEVGSASGIIAFGSGLGGTIFTWIAGRTPYDALFVIMGFLHPLAFLVFLYLMRKRKLAE